MNIKDVVNDPEWQAIRIAFLGTWKLTPEKNVKVLRDYVGNFSDPLKVRRVSNYLTGSGFRSGKIVHSEIDKLLTEIRKARNGQIQH